MSMLRATAVVVFAVLGSLSAIQSPAAQIELRPQAACSQPIVHLSDVATIRGGDPQQAELLASIELFPAPPAGEIRFLRFRELQDLLVRRGVKIESHQFGGAEQIAVSTGNAAPPKSASRPTPPPERKMISRASATAETKTAETKTAERKPAAVRPMVAVAARAVARGTVLRPDDVRLDVAPATADVADSCAALEEAVGQEISVALAEGRAIPRSGLRPPVLIHRGDMVTVYVRTAGMRVRTLARAREDAVAGEPVTLEALGDRQQYLATVTGLREAEVAAPRTAPIAEARLDRQSRR